MHIVDDDIDLSQLAHATEEDLDNYNLGEDLPQIAAIIDERPAELIAKEDYKASAKWKTMGEDDTMAAKNNVGEQTSGNKSCKEAWIQVLHGSIKENQTHRRQDDRSEVQMLHSPED